MSLDLQQNIKDKDANKKRGVSLLSSLSTALSIVVILLILLEILGRTSWIQTQLPLRSVANHHSQFEIKWFKLADFVKQNGGVDVILLGNSMLNTGIDPDVFVEEYEKNTGIHLRVFNFGVEGLTVAPNSLVAKLLVETYHPKTLIYFTEIRDYIAANGNEEAQQFLENDWLSYQLGKKNATGWLIDHSKTLQYWLPFRGWSRPDFLDVYIGDTRRERITTNTGYEMEDNVRDQLVIQPDPNSPEEAPLYQLYGNFSFEPTRLNDLDSILALEDEETNVIISEIPVDPAFYDYFGGESVHKAYYQEITQYVRDHNGTYVEMINTDLIPLNGRSDDYVHMNYKGAELYTSLLAKEFSTLCLNETACLEPQLP